MEVRINGVGRTFEFDPPAKVSSDDEGEASLELLGEAETYEVEMVKGVSAATVEVEYTYTITGSVEVELERLEDENIEDEQDIIALVERGDEDDVYSAIEDEVTRNYDSSSVTIDNVTVNDVVDDDGDSIEL
jgi:hypothetical protein